MGGKLRRMFTPLQFTGVEIGILALVLILFFGVYAILKVFKPLIVNAIVGIIIILLAGAVGYGVEITLLVVLVVAFGGAPGAVLVIILAHFTDVAFEPTMVAFQHLPF